MIVSINQPAYLPWLGYLHRIAVSDLHVVLDHVQFEKNSFVNRNQVLMKHGPVWLTVPVRTKGRFGALPIVGLEVAEDGRWARRHWLTLQQGYGKAAHFIDHRGFFEDTYSSRWDHLVDLVDHCTGYLLQAMDISTPLIRSSELGVVANKSDLILEICQLLGATRYLSGPYGRHYLDVSSFTARGIAVSFHDYVHPRYTQLRPGFLPNMSAVDLLFNSGPDSRSVLMSTANRDTAPG